MPRHLGFRKMASSANHDIRGRRPLRNSNYEDHVKQNETFSDEEDELSYAQNSDSTDNSHNVTPYIIYKPEGYVPNSTDESYESRIVYYSPEYHVPNIASSRHGSTTPHANRTKRRTQTQREEKSNGNNFNFNWFISLVMLSVLILVGGVAYKWFVESEKQKLTCSFGELRERPPLQATNVWKTLSVGVELILNKMTDMPGVYLFMHEGSNAARNLVNEIAQEASQCFGHENKPVLMDSSDFTSKQAIADYGYAIERFKHKIKQGNVIVIVNLNEIPASSARALHTICDTHSPIANDVVIFLTLTAINRTADESPIQLARDTLIELWGSNLEDNELDPLITRVTDQVVPLQN